MCQNTGFVWPLFSSITIESAILGKYKSEKNPYPGIFYAVLRIKCLTKSFFTNINQITEKL